MQITLECEILKLFISIIGELFSLWENSNTSELKKKLKTQGKNSVFRHIHMLALGKRWPNYKPGISIPPTTVLGVSIDSLWAPEHNVMDYSYFRKGGSFVFW